MGFLKFIAYMICIFTPPIGWVILYALMRESHSEKVFYEKLDQVLEEGKNKEFDDEKIQRLLDLIDSEQKSSTK